MERRINATSWPRKFTAKFLEPGLVSYADVGGGLCLLKKETIDKYIDNFVGKPVVIHHPDEVNPQNFEQLAVGYVTDVYYNPEDGWFYCKGLFTKDEGRILVEKGFNVSCAYNGHTTKQPGTWHGVEYDGEITDLEFEHLGLVEKPRYEDCRIYLNSKNNKKGETSRMQILKLFSRKANEAAEDKTKKVEKTELVKTSEKDNAIDVSEDTMIDINGKGVSLKELKAFYEAEMLEKEKQQELLENELDGESEVELSNGSRVKLNEMVSCFTKKNGCGTKKNETEDKEEEKEDKELTIKPRNSAATEAKSHSAFKILKNAAATAKVERVYKNSFADKLARGQARYGSAAKKTEDK